MTASPKSSVATEPQFVAPRAHLHRPGFVFDEFGHPLSLAHAVDHARHLLGVYEDHHLPKLLRASAALHEAGIHEHQTHLDAVAAANKRLTGRWRIDRYDAPIEYYAAKALGVHEDDIKDFNALPAHIQAAADAALKRNHRPYTTEWADYADTFDNTFLTAGINALWTMAEGSTGAANVGTGAAAANAAYNNAQGRIGVGDSTTAAAASQTDLQAATNKYYVAMDATFPTLTNNSTTFRATFGSAAANYAWQEFVVDNCNGSNSTSTTRSGGTTLDRVVSAQGTKASGQTWQPSMTLSIS